MHERAVRALVGAQHDRGYVTVMGNLFRAAVAVLSGLVLAGPVGAATLNEADVAGGDFSGVWTMPTTVAAGATTITGTWGAQNDYDFLALTGLAPGAQVLTFTFAPVTPIGPQDYSFSAGGSVLYKTAPFQWGAWEGATLANVSIQHWNRDQMFSWVLTLTDSFAGSLYLGLYGTYGTLAWTISAPGNAVAAPPPATPAAVPVPAGILLLGSGLAGLAFLRRRRA